MDRIVGDAPDLPTRLTRLLVFLVCPSCRGELTFSTYAADCPACERRYEIRSGRIYFLEVPEREDELDRLKGWLKKHLGKYYYTIGVDIIAPDYPFDFAGKIREYFDPAAGVVLNLGCGNHRIDDDIIGVDLFDYDAVDLVCDIAALPLRDECVDAIASRSVLEHVREIGSVAAEIQRCTRKGGWSLHSYPFLYPFHSSPDDFWRYTDQGFDLLLPGFEVVEKTNTSGPATLALVCTIEFLSILVSFGSSRVKSAATLLFCGLLFPFKYLDFFFVNRPAFRAIAPNLMTAMRKRPGDESTRRKGA